MEVICSDYLLKTGPALMLISETDRSKGVRPVIKDNMDSRALAESSDTFSPPEHTEVVWVPDDEPARDKGPMQCWSWCIALIETSHWDKLLRTGSTSVFPASEAIQARPNVHITSVFRVCLRKTFCEMVNSSLPIHIVCVCCHRRGTVQRYSPCEISPDECPSHCRAFILFLSSLPPLFLLIYRLSLLPGRTDHLTSLFPGLQTASQMQTQGQSTGKHLPKGPIPLEREILFARTKAPPAHLGARKTWPPKCLCKGNKRSTNVIRWNH